MKLKHHKAKAYMEDKTLRSGAVTVGREADFSELFNKMLKA